MKLFNLNIGVKIDNNKEVVDLIKNGSYDIVTLQESMRKLDENVIPFFDSCNVIKKTNKLQKQLLWCFVDSKTT